MSTVLVTNGMTITATPVESVVSPSAAYIAWATELGVSTTDSLYALDADDNAWLTMFASPPVAGGLDSGFFSSEGAIGIYPDPAGGAPIAGSSAYAIPNVTRMYGLSLFPKLMFIFHPQVDCRSVGVKFQRVGTTTIITGRIQSYSGSTHALDFAARFNGSTSQNWIFTTDGTPTDFMLGMGVYSMIASTLFTIPALTTQGVTVGITGTFSKSGYEVDSILLDVAVIPVGGFTPDFSGVKLQPVLKQDKDYTIGSAGWGNGRITGTVKETGTPDVPVFKRVRLHRMVDGMLVREQWSDKVTGAYAFNNIDPSYKFYVVSHDHILNYNAVIKDNLTPEPMP